MAKSAAIKFIAKIAGGIKGGLKGAAGKQTLEKISLRLLLV